MKLDWRDNTQPRDLIAKELSFLNRMLKNDFKGNEQLLCQLKSTKVAAEYKTPGYHTIKLLVEDAHNNRASVADRVPVEAKAIDEDGTKINFLLHVIGGFLAELEIIRDDGKPIQRLPKAESLIVY